MIFEVNPFVANHSKVQLLSLFSNKQRQVSVVVEVGGG